MKFESFLEKKKMSCWKNNENYGKTKIFVKEIELCNEK